MKKVTITEKNFDFLSFTKAILCFKYLIPEDANDESYPDLLIGTDKKGDILFLGKYDLYTDDEVTTDVLTKRVQEYVMYGCNAFNAKRPTSKPLSIWLEKDIWDYIKENNIPYSQIYDMGYNRTGCMFCLYGHHIDKTDRLKLMKETHPKQYEYCMERLGMKEVLEWYPLKRDP